MPLVCITPLREPHVPFDTPGLEVAASPVDSFGSAPAQFLDWLTTSRFSSTQPRLGLLLSDGVRLQSVGPKKKSLRKTPVETNPLVEGQHPIRGQGLT